MNANILITGAAGYIGGSILADLLASNNPSGDQAEAVSTFGIKVIQLNLADEEAVIEQLLRYKINIVIHVASAINSKLSLPLVTALGKQKQISGQQTHYIHTSGLSAFYPKTGWPTEENKDTGSIFKTEKELADSFIVRATDIAIIEHAKALGVRSYLVIPPIVYGGGSGAWNQLSVNFPLYIRGAIASRTMYKFPEDCKVAGVHIKDLTALYGQIVQKILNNESIPYGEEGYYFALAHHFFWWEALERLAASFETRGLITSTEVKNWPSDEFAAETMGVPVQLVQALWNAGEEMVAERPFSIGWKPEWNTERFLNNMGGEIDAVLELGKAKSSLLDSFFKGVEA